MSLIKINIYYQPSSYFVRMLRQFDIFLILPEFNACNHVILILPEFNACNHVILILPEHLQSKWLTYPKFPFQALAQIDHIFPLMLPRPSINLPS